MLAKLAILGVITLLVGAALVPAALAAGESISPAYAWGENLGWINFACDECGVQITDGAVTGYAWSASYGWINLAPSTSGVLNDGRGSLSGSAWSTRLGWISFDGTWIDEGGRFHGVAGRAGSAAGRINFDCAQCAVMTAWRPVIAPPSSRPAGSGGGGGRRPALSAIATSTNRLLFEQIDLVPDGRIDFLDFNRFMVEWGRRGINNRADLNHDGVVDLLDFNLLMVQWNKVRLST